MDLDENKQAHLVNWYLRVYQIGCSLIKERDFKFKHFTAASCSSTNSGHLCPGRKLEDWGAATLEASVWIHNVHNLMNLFQTHVTSMGQNCSQEPHPDSVSSVTFCCLWSCSWGLCVDHRIQNHFTQRRSSSRLLVAPPSLFSSLIPCLHSGLLLHHRADHMIKCCWTLRGCAQDFK